MKEEKGTAICNELENEEKVIKWREKIVKTAKADELEKGNAGVLRYKTGS